ncbi:toxin-antitoxin system, toxin component, PIN family [delta proteobacterium NaphS2]|nr:toxin-antitoxin system, toxin component, PIN family [delta proteobacterium NaphS2]
MDACALIAFLNDEDGAQIVEALLAEASVGNIDLVMNRVNLLEIYYGVYRDDGIQEANSVIERILNLPLTIIDTLTDNVFYKAGKLKAENKISLADAIAIGEANERGAQLVTCDHHEFDALVEEEKMTVCWIR